MNILAIDTSNQVLGIAILGDGQIIGEMITNVKKNQTSRLMPAIHQLMEDIDMVPDQLDKIVVAKGPGSYTGVRIGVTTAKSLAWALSIPVVGISSLEVLAYQGRLYDSLICPFFDARRMAVFTGLYKWEENKLIQIIDEKNIGMEEWLKVIKQYEKEILFVSPDIKSFNQMIVAELGSLAIIPEKPFHLPKPSHLALAGLRRSPDETHTLAPNYLRMAEAEANWLKSQGIQTNE